MGDVNLAVMPTAKGPIRPGGLQNIEIERSHNVGPTLAIRNLLNVPAGEGHRQGAAWQVVGDEHATDLHEKVADRVIGVSIARAIGTIAVALFLLGKPADGINLHCAERTITEVHLG